MAKNKMTSRQIWLAIGAAVLIILLILWLTGAMFAGDTDVAACLPLF